MKALLELFLTFFKLGLFTFGGGYAMLPQLKETVIEKKKWLTEDEVLNMIAISESTPGPIAINMATYVGSTQGGLLGSILATLGVVLPSLIIILLIATILKKAIKNKYVLAFLNGLKPIVIALISATGLMLVLKVLGYQSLQIFNFNIVSLITFVTLAASYCITRYVFKRKVNTILFILFSAILGIIFSLIFI